MLFLAAIILRIVAANVVTATLIKKASGQGRNRRFVFQFVFAAIIAWGLAYTAHAVQFTATFWLIASIGFVNAIAAYCQWRAMDISMSKSALYMWADDVIAMLLASLVLHEERFVTPLMGFGIILSLAAVLIFVWRDVLIHNSAQGHSPLMLWVWVSGYSLIWGVAMFLLRYFAVSGIQTPSFLMPWYCGAFVGAIVVYVIGLTYPVSTKQTDTPASVRQDLTLSLGLALGILISLALGYWALQLAPLIVVQPTFLIAEMIFPVLIGLFGFGEKKEVNRIEALCYFLGSLGAVCIALGFVTS